MIHTHLSFTHRCRQRCCSFVVVLTSILIGSTPIPASDDDVQQLAIQIDEHIARQWAADSISPVSRADDGEFLRRAWLDIGGRIPTAAGTIDFLDDESPGKRRKLIDDLLDGPNYVVSSTNVWRRVLIPEADTDFNVRYVEAKRLLGICFVLFGDAETARAEWLAWPASGTLQSSDADGSGN